MHLLIYPVAFLWAVFTGFIFSSVGAAGGILASFGFITVLHIPVANSVKVMSQILIIISPLIALPIYLRQDRAKKIKSVLFYLGFIIAFGAIIGAILGSWFSMNYLAELKSFKYLFGYLTFVVAGLMVYNIFKQRKRQNKQDAPVEDLMKSPAISKVSFTKIDFRCLSKDYSVSPPFLFFAGFVIAIISSIFGVGGGFLIVPFLTDINGLPVFLAAGISILVVLISSVVSVSNYIRMGVHVIITILLVTIVGVILGSVLGPKISQHLNEKWLKYTLIVLLFFIGVFYLSKP